MDENTVESVQSCIRAVERLYSCGICMYDHDHELLSLFPEVDSAHFMPCCNTVKAHDRNDVHCIDFYNNSVFPFAEKHRMPFWKICPFGIMELVAPVIVNRRVRGILQAGGFKSRPNLPEENCVRAPLRRNIPDGIEVKCLSGEEFSELPNLMNLLAERIGRHAELVQNAPEPARNPKEIIEDFINKQFRSPIMLSDIAGLLKLTEPHTSLKIKKLFGRNFKEILLEKRLENACLLLAESSYKIKNVHLNSGFFDAAYFHREFRKKYAMTPLEYRQKFNRKTS